MTKLKFAASPAIAAALALVATPAAAAELPVQTSRSAVGADLAWAPGDEIAEHHRRYRYGRYGRYRHRTTAGDVLAGVLIIGGIAAIASAANKNRDREYRRDYPRDRDRRYRDSDSRYDGSRGIDRAVSMCVREIERDVRVDEVNSVDRNGDGWLVTGSLFNGEAFACSIGRDGRIDNVDYGSGRSRFQGRNDQGERFDASAQDDRQYDDARYRSAWANVDQAPAPTAASPSTATTADDPQPAYPGGPIDGDLAEDEIGTGYQGAGN